MFCVLISQFSGNPPPFFRPILSVKNIYGKDIGCPWPGDNPHTERRLYHQPVAWRICLPRGCGREDPLHRIRHFRRQSHARGFGLYRLLHRYGRQACRVLFHIRQQQQQDHHLYYCGGYGHAGRPWYGFHSRHHIRSYLYPVICLVESQIRYAGKRRCRCLHARLGQGVEHGQDTYQQQYGHYPETVHRYQEQRRYYFRYCHRFIPAFRQDSFRNGYCRNGWWHPWLQGRLQDLLRRQRGQCAVRQRQPVHQIQRFHRQNRVRS